MCTCCHRPAPACSPSQLHCLRPHKQRCTALCCTETGGQISPTVHSTDITDRDARYAQRELMTPRNPVLFVAIHSDALWGLCRVWAAASSLGGGLLGCHHQPFGAPPQAASLPARLSCRCRQLSAHLPHLGVFPQAEGSSCCCDHSAGCDPVHAASGGLQLLCPRLCLHSMAVHVLQKRIKVYP